MAIWNKSKKTDQHYTSAMCELTCLALLMALRSVEYVKTKRRMSEDRKTKKERYILQIHREERHIQYN